MQVEPNPLDAVPAGPRPLHPFLDHDGPLAFAHRGGAAEAPENTMAAFDRAVRLGFEYLELDVRATADGRVVVFHDHALDRMTGHRGRIGRYRWDQLRRLRVAGKEPIPQLIEVLRTWPDVRVNIDAKCDAVVEPLTALLRQGDMFDRVCVMGFSDRRLARIRLLCGPRLCTALGPAGMTRLRLRASGAPIRQGPGDVAQVPSGFGRVRLLDRAVVHTAGKQGLQLHAWVIDDRDEMHRLLDLGVRGIMSDHPTRLRDVLLERGEWAR